MQALMHCACECVCKRWLGLRARLVRVHFLISLLGYCVRNADALYVRMCLRVLVVCVRLVRALFFIPLLGDCVCKR